jgi:hypothetical protein
MPIGWALEIACSIADALWLSGPATDYLETGAVARRPQRDRDHTVKEKWEPALPPKLGHGAARTGRT